MKMSPYQLRVIIRKALLQEQRYAGGRNTLKKTGEKLFHWMKDPDWEKEVKRIKKAENIKTLGDLKFVLDMAMQARTDRKAANAWGKFAKSGLADIIGLGIVGNISDVMQDMYYMDDDAKTGTALDYLNVDDAIAKIVADEIETAFLNQLVDDVTAAEERGELDMPIKDFNVTKRLADYIAKNIENRTVTGYPEAS